MVRSLGVSGGRPGVREPLPRMKTRAGRPNVGVARLSIVAGADLAQTLETGDWGLEVPRPCRAGHQRVPLRTFGGMDSVEVEYGATSDSLAATRGVGSSCSYPALMPPTPHASRTTLLGTPPFAICRRQRGHYDVPRPRRRRR